MGGGGQGRAGVQGPAWGVPLLRTPGNTSYTEQTFISWSFMFVLLYQQHRMMIWRKWKKKLRKRRKMMRKRRKKKRKMMRRRRKKKRKRRLWRKKRRKWRKETQI